MSTQRTFFYQTLGCMYIFSICSWLIPLASVSPPLTATNSLLVIYSNNTPIYNSTITLGSTGDIVKTACELRHKYAYYKDPLVSIYAIDPTDNTNGINRNEYRMITYLNLFFTLKFVVFMLVIFFRMARVENFNQFLKAYLSGMLGLMLLMMFVRLIYLNANPAALSYHTLSYQVKGRFYLGNSTHTDCESTRLSFDTVESFVNFASNWDNFGFLTKFDDCMVGPMINSSAWGMVPMYLMNCVLYLTTVLILAIHYFKPIHFEEIVDYEQIF